MEKIIDVAQYVYKYYLKETDEKIDEMKLHKLLYFAYYTLDRIVN